MYSNAKNLAHSKEQFLFYQVKLLNKHLLDYSSDNKQKIDFFGFIFSKFCQR